MTSWVRWSDARAVFELLDEVRLLAPSPEAWRARFIRGLCELVDADVALAAEAPGGRLLAGEAHLGVVEGGWATASDRATWLGACERPGIDPSDEAIARLGARSFTHARRELAADATWRRSAMLNDHYRPAGLGDFLMSSMYVPSRGVSHYVLLMKRRGRRVSERDRDVVAHAHRELAASWGATPRLAPSLRRTLRLLGVGRSEKEIAAELSLSAHTVRDHCKALHRRFAVHSRSELLAATKALARQPVLSSELDASP
jgi:DNA-binding CsgD family transcriptional regulator